MADFVLHSGSSGPFVSMGANGQKQYHSPRGKLFAIDAEGQHILTCAPHGGLIYKVVVCVIFITARRSYVSAVLGVVILSVRPSVTRMLFGRLFVKRFALCYRSVVCLYVCPVCL